MKLKDYLYYSEDKVKLYNADCLDILRKLPDNYIDLIVTDPPYALKFMGKDWDKTLPSIEIWKECLRILKSGAFAFIMSAPRQDVLSRMIYNLQEAGFETGFSSIYWSYATGFPKASNIGKKIDKRLGRKRKIIGKKKGTYADIRRDKETGKAELHGGMAVGKERIESYITIPVSPQAQKLDGSYGGFQPKPAVEIIIIAMKPLSEKTYVDQALKNGKGITWLDNCRVPYESEKDKWNYPTGAKGSLNTPIGQQNRKYKFEPVKADNKGRFPANLIVSDDVLNDGKITKGGGIGGRGRHGRGEGYGFKPTGQTDKTGKIPKDSGSYSRYFDLDKWWAEKIKKLPSEVQKVFPYLIVPKASKSEKNKGLLEKGTGSNTYNRKCLNCGKWQRKQGLTDNYTCHCESPNWEKPKGNNHPTVKPIKLMSYLITLGSREGEIVLDPFTGSGTTLIASKLLNRKGIGIEMSGEYCNIAKARIKGWSK